MVVPGLVHPTVEEAVAEAAAVVEAEVVAAAVVEVETTPVEAVGDEIAHAIDVVHAAEDPIGERRIERADTRARHLVVPPTNSIHLVHF